MLVVGSVLVFFSFVFLYSVPGQLVQVGVGVVVVFF